MPPLVSVLDTFPHVRPHVLQIRQPVDVSSLFETGKGENRNKHLWLEEEVIVPSAG